MRQSTYGGHLLEVEHTIYDLDLPWIPTNIYYGIPDNFATEGEIVAHFNNTYDKTDGKSDDCPILDEFGNDYCQFDSAGSRITRDAESALNDIKTYLNKRYYEAAITSTDVPGDKTHGYKAFAYTGRGVVQYLAQVEAYYIANEYSTRRIPIQPNFLVYKAATCPDGYNKLEEDGVCSNSTQEEIKVYTDFYLQSELPSEQSCPATPEGNPMNPAGGNKFQPETDYASHHLGFTRYYNSLNTHVGTNGAGWQHNYDYHASHSDVKYRIKWDDLFTQTSLYSQANQACSVGWEQLKDRGLVPQSLQDTTSTFVSGKPQCELTRNGEHVAYIPLKNTYREEYKVENSLFLSRPDGAKVLIDLSTGTIKHAPKRLQGKITAHTHGDGFKVTLPHQTEYYNAEGHITTIVDSHGNETQLSYDDNKQLATVHSNGHTLTFEYDAEQRIAAVTPNDQAAIEYQYDDQGRLSHVHYPDQTSREYLYQHAERLRALTGIINEKGILAAQWDYDQYGRATLSQHAQGVDATTLTHSGSHTDVELPLGATKRLEYDIEQGRYDLSSIVYSNGKTATMQYNNAGHLIEKTDYNGQIIRYTRDAKGRVIQITRAADTADATSTTTQWHPTLDKPQTLTQYAGLPSTGTALLSHQWEYLPGGQTTQHSQTDLLTGETRTTTYTYYQSNDGRNGKLQTIDGPRTDLSDITHYRYHNNGDLYEIENALGHITRILEHDPHGNPTRIEDPNGIITQLQYDLRQRLTHITVDNATTTYTYDAVGNLTQTQDPDGVTTIYEYDAANRLIATQNALGHRIEYQLDNAGNITQTQVKDNAGNITQSQTQLYDQLSRLTDILGNHGQHTKYSHTALDNVQDQTDNGEAGAQYTTQYLRDALERIHTVIDAQQGSTHYQYNTLDHLVAVTDPNGNTTQYRVNAFGERTQRTSPDTGITTYQYDAAGNRTQQTDARDITVTYQYDALNRLTHVTYPEQAGQTNPANITYTYDDPNHSNSIGRISRIEDQAGSHHYHYNAHGRVTQITQNLYTSHNAVEAKQSFSQEYRYTAGQRLSQTTLPSGHTITRHRNAAGQVTQLDFNNTPLIQDMQYHAHQAGPIVNAWTYANGIQIQRHYDLDGRLQNQSSLVENTQWQYSPRNNIKTIVDDTQGHQRHYQYDALNRLINDHNPSDQRHYQYDANSNRVQRSRDFIKDDGTAKSNQQSLHYAPGSNRLIKKNKQPDLISGPAGRLLAEPKRNRTYAYNAAGRLSHFSKTTTTTIPQEDGTQTTQSHQVDAHYRYNTQNQRTLKIKSKDEKERTTLFHYNPQGQLISETQYNVLQIKKKVIEWVWLNTMPVAQITTTYRNNGNQKSQEIVYLHPDHLNTPRAATNVQGQIVWQWIGDAFGQVQPNRDPDQDGNKTWVKLRFAGQYRDGESGLYYNWHRYYDPSTGRYIQSDPIAALYDFSDPQLQLAKFGRQLSSEEQQQLMAMMLEKHGLNHIFGYANQNPLNFIDPYGLSTEKLWIMREAGRTAQTFAQGRKIRKVNQLCEKWGGKPKEWKKRKGWDPYGNEYHWYERGGKKYGWKRAGEPDPF